MVWMDLDSLIDYSVLPVIFILLWNNSLGIFFPPIMKYVKHSKWLRIMWSMPSLSNPGIAIFALRYSGGRNRCPSVCPPQTHSSPPGKASPEFGVPHPRSCFYLWIHIQNQCIILFCIFNFYRNVLITWQLALFTCLSTLIYI